MSSEIALLVVGIMLFLYYLYQKVEQQLSGLRRDIARNEQTTVDAAKHQVAFREQVEIYFAENARYLSVMARAKGIITFDKIFLLGFVVGIVSCYILSYFF